MHPAPRHVGCARVRSETRIEMKACGCARVKDTYDNVRVEKYIEDLFAPVSFDGVFAGFPVSFDGFSPVRRKHQV